MVESSILVNKAETLELECCKFATPNEILHLSNDNREKQILRASWKNIPRPLKHSCQNLKLESDQGSRSDLSHFLRWWKFSFLKRFYLFIFTGGKEGEREGKKHVCGCLSDAPYQGPGLQPRHVPWLGIEPAKPLVHRPALNPLSHTSQGEGNILYLCYPIPGCPVHV